MLDEAERALYAAACKACTKIACPYLAACFGRIYPGNAQLIDLARATQPLTKLMDEWAEAETASGSRLQRARVPIACCASSVCIKACSTCASSGFRVLQVQGWGIALNIRALSTCAPVNAFEMCIVLSSVLIGLS